jgi:threonine dehydratase
MPVHHAHIKIARSRRAARRSSCTATRIPTRTRTRALRQRRGATFVHPYDDPDVIAGQGTIGMEILRQCQGRSTRSSSRSGGGGLIAGIARYVKRVRPDVR